MDQRMEVFEKDLVIQAVSTKFGNVVPLQIKDQYSFFFQEKEYRMEATKEHIYFRTKKDRTIVSFGGAYGDRSVCDYNELVEQLANALQYDEEQFSLKKKERQQSKSLPSNQILEEALQKIKEITKSAQFAWKASSADDSACLKWPTHSGMMSVRLFNGRLQLVWNHSEARNASSGIQIVIIPKFDDPTHQPEKIMAAVVSVVQATVFMSKQMTALRNVLEEEAHQSCNLALSSLGTLKEED